MTTLAVRITSSGVFGDGQGCKHLYVGLVELALILITKRGFTESHFLRSSTWYTVIKTILRKRPHWVVFIVNEKSTPYIASHSHWLQASVARLYTSQPEQQANNPSKPKLNQRAQHQTNTRLCRSPLLAIGPRHGSRNKSPLLPPAKYITIWG